MNFGMKKLHLFLARISHTGVVKMRRVSREKQGDEEEAGLNTLRPTSNEAFPSKNKQIRRSRCVESG